MLRFESFRLVFAATYALAIAGWLVGGGAAAEPLAVAAKTNEILLAEIKSDASQPQVTVNDAVFVRRAYLDILGKPPSPEDVTAFVLDPDSAKRAKLVDKLLADPAYGLNWARYWRDVIMFRKTEERGEIVSESLVDYLTAEFNRNSAWSKIATDMITAQGDAMENGACALIVAQQGQPEETVAEVSRIFLGVQIQCAQCHDHPTDRWKRQQFHELAAFFPRVASRLIVNPEKRSIMVTVNDQPKAKEVKVNNKRFRGEAEHYMPDLKHPTEKGTLTQPVFFATGDKLPLGAKDADRRGSLAQWITEKKNPYFAQAFVNRLWGELTGEGFYEPLDDIGPDRQCSAPQTCQYLAKEFAAANYDVKWLFRAIMATRLYQAPSGPRRNAEQPPFQVNVNQKLRSDQMFDSLLATLGASEPAPPAGQDGMRYAFRRSPRYQFEHAFGYDPSAKRDEVIGTIPQALIMMNSPVLNRSIRAAGATPLGRMVNEIKDDKGLISELYLRTLARPPSSHELQVCQEFVREVGNRNEAFEDLQWTLINSAEFQHRK